MKNKTPPWFKVLALCTAVGLGGTYVWRQQQKAEPQIHKPAERTVLSGSKSTVIAPTPLPMDQEKTEPVLLPGSKGGIIELKLDKDRVLMPGSKSAIVTPQERTLLPSSKSIPMPVFRERRLVPEDQPKPDKP